MEILNNISERDRSKSANKELEIIAEAKYRVSLYNLKKFDNNTESAKDLKMFSYPVVDVNGFIWAWHHLNKEEPAWEVPVIEGFNGDDEKWGKSKLGITRKAEEITDVKSSFCILL